VRNQDRQRIGWVVWLMLSLLLLGVLLFASRGCY
jgi:hypothetical protein